MLLIVGGLRNDAVVLATLGQRDGGRVVCREGRCESRLGIGILEIGIGLFVSRLQGIVEVGSGETYTAADALGEDAGSLLQVLLGLGEFGGLEVVLGVGVAQTFEDFIVRLDALEEGHPILLGIGQPPDFGDGEHTRQELVLQFDAVVEGLGPEVALHAEAVVFAAREAAEGVEVVNGGEIDHAVFAPAAEVRFVDNRTCLVNLHHVEIERLVRHNDALHTEVGGLTALVDAVPSHDDGLGLIGRFPVAQEFIPNDDILAKLLLEVDAQLLDEPGLQLVDARQPFFLDAAQAVGIVGPLLRGTFVATDVDVGMGEDAGHVAEDAFEEVDDLVLADIEHVVGDAARQAHAVLLRWVATEFGIGGDGSHHVAREVDFGKDFDVACGSVGHDFAELVLRIVHAAAVLRIVIEGGGGAGIGERTAAHGSYLRQTGIFGDFDAPALVVGEVPVEAIHLVEGHDVEHALDLLHTEEVARHVHHETAMAEERAVLNADIGQGPFYGIAARKLGIEEGAGEQLTQGLEGVEEACGRGCLDGDALGRHFEVVGFLSEGIVLNEANIVVGLCALGRA